MGSHTLKLGRPLTPLISQVIPQGYVFVAASASGSFDSRYAEFGLVKFEHLQGRTWGWGRQDVMARIMVIDVVNEYEHG